MNNPNKISSIILWIARISGSMIVAFVLFFLISHLFGDDESGDGFRNTRELITFLFFPISTTVGLAIALKWEGLGGIITLVGMIGLFVLRPDLLNSMFMAIPIIPAILYIIYWLMSKK